MEDNIWHVIPLRDLMEHSDETEWRSIEWKYLNVPNHAIHRKDKRLISHCECKPAIEVLDNEKILIIHNSFDGREGIKWVNEILK